MNCQAPRGRNRHLLRRGRKSPRAQQGEEIMTATHQVLAPAAPAPDYEAIKARQRATWATGDYGRIGVTLQIVGEELAESAGVSAADRVLDVAAGSGNASLA